MPPAQKWSHTTDNHPICTKVAKWRDRFLGQAKQASIDPITQGPKARRAARLIGFEWAGDVMILFSVVSCSMVASSRKALKRVTSLYKRNTSAGSSASILSKVWIERWCSRHFVTATVIPDDCIPAPKSSVPQTLISIENLHS